MLLRSQYLFLDTSRCTGTPCDFQVNIPPSYVKCDATERIRASLIKWTCRNDWYAIRAPYNAFTVTRNGVETTITTPEGNPTYSQYATQLETALNASKVAMGVSSGNIIVTHDTSTNKLHFMYPDTLVRTMAFPEARLKQYGMTSSAKTFSGTLTSSIPVDFYGGDERLMVYVAGQAHHKAHSLGHAQLPNGNGASAMDNSQALWASMSVNACPYTTITFEQPAEAYAHWLHGDHIHGTLHFKIKNQKGEDATYLPHSEMVLRIDVFRDEVADTAALLKGIDAMTELLRLLFVSTNLSRGGDLPPAAQTFPTAL
jgi:hypothetical protein